MTALQEYDVVALTENTSATYKTTHQPILLRRGQIGTVLITFDDQACLIDFADSQGMTYAMETISMSRLLLLLQEPEIVPAQ
ncbi:MAG: DUF4926 domain-containing protein [Plectolyngbya sp. WJT66-NPBG17]|jgi:hypothetical protein|nr:DUF4926 domain-containing protein [Plectolyngbya sp. WJT66-NPBG17]MBW4527957.1 DUF4926 domain-containing protein [Phormidium tanganyikae FI6-MK23]